MAKQKQYSIMDMQDAYSLSESDLKWALHAIGDIGQKFRELRADIQKAYGAHDLYFDELSDFIGMYDHLIESRYEYHKEQAAHFEAEAKQQ